MKLYSDFPARRTAQIVADVVAVGLIALAVWIGTIVHDAVAALAQFGQSLEDAGAGFEQNMADAGDTLGGIPLIGGGIRGPFDAASDAGQQLAAAGQAQQDVVFTTATVLGVVAALIPIAIVLAIWLPRRIRFALRAGEASRMGRLPDGPDVLALRALMTADARDLSAVDREPVAGWRRGDARVVRALADLELREAGVRLRA